MISHSETYAEITKALVALQNNEVSVLFDKKNDHFNSE